MQGSKQVAQNQLRRFSRLEYHLIDPIFALANDPGDSPNPIVFYGAGDNLPNLLFAVMTMGKNYIRSFGKTLTTNLALEHLFLFTSLKVSTSLYKIALIA
jgi:hypothetical protein